MHLPMTAQPTHAANCRRLPITSSNFFCSALAPVQCRDVSGHRCKHTCHSIISQEKGNVLIERAFCLFVSCVWSPDTFCADLLRKRLEEGSDPGARCPRFGRIAVVHVVIDQNGVGNRARVVAGRIWQDTVIGQERRDLDPVR
jgi:hypothetical protein